MLRPGTALAGLWLACAAPPSQGAAAPANVMRVNGVAIAIEQRVLAGAPAELAERLAGRWGERLPDVAGQVAGATRQRLGRQRGAFHETLTLAPGPGLRTSIALVAAQDLRRPPAPPPSPPFALPPGLRVVNVVEFGATGGVPAAFTLDGATAPRHALDAIVAAARAGGWTLAVAPSVTGAGAGAAAWARRGGAELAIVAVRAGARTRVALLLAPAAAEGLP